MVTFAPSALAALLALALASACVARIILCLLRNSAQSQPPRLSYALDRLSRPLELVITSLIYYHLLLDYRQVTLFKYHLLVVG